MLLLNQFNYQLSQEKIAQQPVSPRDHSKLMVLDRDKESISNHHFYNLVDLLDNNYIVVRNNSQVIPARLFAHKLQTGGKIELLLTKQIDQDKNIWQCLSKPGLKLNQVIKFNEQLQAKTIKLSQKIRYIQFNIDDKKLRQYITKQGLPPLPPYIKQKIDPNYMKKQYQTVYAKQPGSVAAPTAGLHFTHELEQQLINKGIQIYDITLHVGLGTFEPVKTNKIRNHQMHSEDYILDKSTTQILNQAKRQGKKILAVGTTTTRVLESCAHKSNTNNNYYLQAQQGSTQIFIYPPYKFKFIDALITNFHLPKSTLLMLVSAFCSQPNCPHKFENFSNTLVGKAYEHAKDQNYRFYSFGDAMLIK